MFLKNNGKRGQPAVNRQLAGNIVRQVRSTLLALPVPPLLPICMPRPLSKLRVTSLGVALLVPFWLASAAPLWSSELPKMRVELVLEQEPALRLEVRVTLEGEADGETLMGVSNDWGGVPAERVDLQHVTATNAAGEELTVEVRSSFEWNVVHAPSETFTLSAWLLPNELRKSGQSSDHYRPILEPELFQGISHLFMPRQAVADGDEDLIELTLAFEGFEDAGWDVVHSFGLGSQELEIEVTRSRLSGMLFSAGKLQIHTLEIRGGLLAVTLDSTKWRFDGAEFADLVAEIIDLEREYMDDDSAPFYWVGAIATGAAKANGYSFGGTGLTNSFALFLQPNTVIDANSPIGPHIRKLLGHECFHEWNGLRIRMDSPEEQNYWFSEGFTDFFGRNILHRGGVLDDKTFVGMINTVLRDYHTSPVRNLPAAELGKIFWTDGDAQKQPYLRGELMAMLIDHAILGRSDGDEDLSDLMRALLDEADLDPEQRFDTPELLERIGRFTGPELLPLLRGICVDGETVVLPEDVFGAAFTVGTSMQRMQDGSELEIQELCIRK
ncbi:MAG: hypothetical protein ACI8QC_004397 [Planctomycetota bacterium]|jgi:hypothetical protein